VRPSSVKDVLPVLDAKERKLAKSVRKSCLRQPYQGCRQPHGTTRRGWNSLQRTLLCFQYQHKFQNRQHRLAALARLLFTTRRRRPFLSCCSTIVYRTIATPPGGPRDDRLAFLNNSSHDSGQYFPAYKFCKLRGLRELEKPGREPANMRMGKKYKTENLEAIIHTSRFCLCFCLIRVYSRDSRVPLGS
jgi:hypothetical protein